MPRRTLSQLQAQVDAWNADHDIGTPVLARVGFGRGEIRTRTQSKAGRYGTRAMIWVAGAGKEIPLDRVRPVKAPASRETAPC